MASNRRKRFSGFFHSSNIGPGDSNLYAYENDEVDELIDEQASEMDPDRRTEIIHEIQEHLREDMPIVPLLVQERIMPYNQERFQNPVPIIEQGLGSFWNYLNIEPVGDDAHLRTTMAEDINALNPLDQTARGTARCSDWFTTGSFASLPTSNRSRGPHRTSRRSTTRGSKSPFARNDVSRR